MGNFVVVGGTTEPGGLHIHTAEVARALAQAGHSVRVLSTSKDYFSAPLRGSGVEVFQVLVPERADSRLHGFLAWRKALQPFSDPSATCLLLRGSGGQSPLSTTAAVWSSFGRIIAIEHRVPDPVRRTHLHPSRLALRRLVSSSIAVSETVRTAMTTELGYARDRVQVVPNWVEGTRFEKAAHHREALRAQWGIRPDERVFGFVGRLGPEKRVDWILSAFAEVHRDHPKTRLLIFGDGWKRKELEGHLQGLEARGLPSGAARFLGWWSDPTDAYALMDALVLASELEGFPIVVLEAMAAGVIPLVHVRASGDCVRDGVHGFVRDLKSAGDVSRLMVEWLLTPVSGLERLRSEGRQAIRTKYSKEAGIERMGRALGVSLTSAPSDRYFVFKQVQGASNIEATSFPRLVSVVIPTHNRSSYLRRAIDSVRAQTMPRWEIVVVDDRSTDDTRDLVLALGKDDPRIRYTANVRSQGPGGARNHGVEVASGDLVAFLDSDDLWRAKKLENMCAHRAANPAVRWVASDYLIVDENQRQRGTDFLVFLLKWWSEDTTLRRLRHWPSAAEDRSQFADADFLLDSALCGFLWIHTSSLMIDRSVFGGDMWFDEKFRRTEDIRFWLRVNQRHALGFVDEVLAEYETSGRDDARGDRYEHLTAEATHTRFYGARAHLELCSYIATHHVLSRAQRGALAHLRGRSHRDVVRAAKDKPLWRSYHRAQQVLTTGLVSIQEFFNVLEDGGEISTARWILRQRLLHGL